VQLFELRGKLSPLATRLVSVDRFCGSHIPAKMMLLSAVQFKTDSSCVAILKSSKISPSAALPYSAPMFAVFRPMRAII